MTSALRIAACALLALSVAPSILADEFKPAYLQLTQLDATRYAVLWKVPALDENTTLGVRPVFPAGTRDRTPSLQAFAGGTAVHRWTIDVPHGLVGHFVEFPGLAASRIDVLVRMVRMDGTTQLGRVTPIDGRFEIFASPASFEVARTYTTLGIEHILLGVDHLLFVLALVLLVDGTRRLLWTITAFTVAHSITLAAASLGVLNVPGPPVEASIALSIVFVASEIIHARQGRRGLTQRRPWLVAFTFGLLHGLGFASALAEAGLPDGQIPLALLFFNLGVEIGQVMFVLAVLAVLAIGAGARWGAQYWSLQRPAWAWRVLPYSIGGLASYWAFERVASF
jgi:hydrogenase/urease accessory protein HupE